MKNSGLLFTLLSLTLVIACSQSNEEQTTVQENGSATLTLQVTGMT